MRDETRVAGRVNGRYFPPRFHLNCRGGRSKLSLCWFLQNPRRLCSHRLYVALWIVPIPNRLDLHLGSFANQPCLTPNPLQRFQTSSTASHGEESILFQVILTKLYATRMSFNATNKLTAINAGFGRWPQTEITDFFGGIIFNPAGSVVRSSVNIKNWCIAWSAK